LQVYELVEIGSTLRLAEAAVRLTSMRGDERVQDGMFSCVSLEQRVLEGIISTQAKQGVELFADGGSAQV
jgi:hypothetical protein